MTLVKKDASSEPLHTIPKEKFAMRPTYVTCHRFQAYNIQYNTTLYDRRVAGALNIERDAKILLIWVVIKKFYQKSKNRHDYFPQFLNAIYC